MTRPYQYQFVIPGEPIAQKRARAAVRTFGGKSRAIVYDDRSVSLRTGRKGEIQSFLIAELERLRLPVPFFEDEPLRVDTLFVFTCPKSLHRKRSPVGRQWHVKKPDVDNLRKLVLDAATGVLWLDDRQVVTGLSTKIIGAQGEAPYTSLAVYAAPDHDIALWKGSR